VKIFLIAAATTGLCACTTLGTVTAEERANCERMAATMGLATPHDHNEMRGVRAQAPMTRQHERCQAILQQAARDGR
jgi:hypothetical protein